MAVFYTELGGQLPSPPLGADAPLASLPLRRARATIDRALDEHVTYARI